MDSHLIRQYSEECNSKEQLRDQEHRPNRRSKSIERFCLNISLIDFKPS